MQFTISFCHVCIWTMLCLPSPTSLHVFTVLCQYVRWLSSAFLILAELSTEQILNLRRREALAYESDVFEQANKEKQSDVNRQEKLELQLRQLRKTMTHVKVTCEAATVDEWSNGLMYIVVSDTFLVASVCLSPSDKWSMCLFYWNPSHMGCLPTSFLFLNENICYSCTVWIEFE